MCFRCTANLVGKSDGKLKGWSAVLDNGGCVFGYGGEGKGGRGEGVVMLMVVKGKRNGLGESDCQQ